VHETREKNPMNLSRVCNYFRPTTRICSASGTSIEVNPSEIFRLVSVRDIDGALALCEQYAKTVKLSPVEFLGKQCSERSYLIYRLSVDSRSTAIDLAQSGTSASDSFSAHNLLDEHAWNENVREQYHRAINCLNLSRTALQLQSPNPARDYQIIGKSVVHKLLLGRTATVLQAFMSRALQETKKPYEWAIVNHRKAARLFDEELAPAGPIGPLESPETSSHDVEAFKSWSERRIKSTNEHIRLIVHLASDVCRHVLSRDDAQHFLNAAESILTEEIDDLDQLKYAMGVINSTRKRL
jgi:hypothetical protein